MATNCDFINRITSFFTRVPVSIQWLGGNESGLRFHVGAIQQEAVQERIADCSIAGSNIIKSEISL